MRTSISCGSIAQPAVRPCRGPDKKRGRTLAHSGSAPLSAGASLLFSLRYCDGQRAQVRGGAARLPLHDNLAVEGVCSAAGAPPPVPPPPVPPPVEVLLVDPPQEIKPTARTMTRAMTARPRARGKGFCRRLAAIIPQRINASATKAMLKAVLRCRPSGPSKFRGPF